MKFVLSMVLVCLWGLCFNRMNFVTWLCLDRGKDCLLVVSEVNWFDTDSAVLCGVIKEI